MKTTLAGIILISLTAMQSFASDVLNNRGEELSFSSESNPLMRTENSTTFAPPIILGKEVDRCFFSPRYTGSNFCNDTATWEVAHQICLDLGYHSATYWSTRFHGMDGDVPDVALEEVGGNGSLIKRWKHTKGSNRFLQVNCN